MKIEPIRVVVPVGVGVVDEVLEWQDEENARTSVAKKWTTWGRVGLCALGYLGQILNVQSYLGSVIAQGETVLVTKTVGEAIRTRAATPAESMVSRAAAVKRTGGVRGSISQTAKPGFEGLRTY